MREKYKAFNINNDVKFKINPLVEKDICDYWSDVYNSKETLDSLFGKEDEDGYRSCQTWVLIKYIGPFIRVECKPAIETTVYFMEKNLSDYTFDKRPPTQKQIDFIEAICRVLELRVPMITNITKAKDWISSHIDEYHTELKHLKEFENYDWSMPNGD